MSVQFSAQRLFHTVRYLRPGQVWGRLWFRLYRPRPSRERLADLALPVGGTWVAPARREPSLLGAGRVLLLGVEGEISSVEGWNRRDRDKLWLYNLHYFDDLNARDWSHRVPWQRYLIGRWVAENPPFAGNGWEPYPTSLRLVNWFKWALAGNALEGAWVRSLALQARWLRRRIEWHLLGNHLFVNAKALIFSGLCLDGDEAHEWLRCGLGILARELPEQILGDAGHFERSPLYHALILEDLLDLINLARAATLGRGLPVDLGPMLAGARGDWERTVIGMQRWLRVMRHPDGEIVLFNDAAFGIAPTPGELDAYGRRLGLGVQPNPIEGIVHLKQTGFVRLTRGPAVAFLDCAPIGPDYLPGHAHADTLSFELSLWGERVIVDSGTDRYGACAERLRQRGTAAHNTVEIDGEDSSEVWGGFRVARRAYPLELSAHSSDLGLVVACAHSGYRRLPGRAVHRREWRLDSRGIVIRDHILGGFAQAVSRLHLHPGVRVEFAADACSGVLWFGAHRAQWQALGAARVLVVSSSYHPRFGVCEPSQCIDFVFGGAQLEVRLTWG